MECTEDSVSSSPNVLKGALQMACRVEQKPLSNNRENKIFETQLSSPPSATELQPVKRLHKSSFSVHKNEYRVSPTDILRRRRKRKCLAQQQDLCLAEVLREPRDICATICITGCFSQTSGEDHRKNAYLLCLYVGKFWAFTGICGC